MFTEQVDQEGVCSVNRLGVSHPGVHTTLQRAQNAFGGKEGKETKPLTAQLDMGMVGEDDM